MSVEARNTPTAEAFLDGLGVRSRRITFMGVPMDPLDMDETVAIVDQALARRVRLKHVVVNVAKLIGMRSDAELRRDVVESDLINIDGMGVVWGARLCGRPVPTRVTGIDLMERILELCAQRGYRPYVLGARQDVLERAIDRIRKRYPAIQFAGWRNGYFGREDEPGIVEAIRASGADCLFVAISSPTKERFTQQYRDQLGVPFLMGVGGSIDVMAGITRRAPVWVQKIGMEWLYRLLQEPKRMWRRYYTTNRAFAALLISELLRERVFRRPLAQTGKAEG